jgi:D-alanyl-D-alanine carboxypeptidase
MTLKTFLSASAAATLLACAPAERPATASGPAGASHLKAPPLNTAELDSIIQRVMTEKQLVGLSIGVMQEGEPVFVKAYGFRSLAPNVPVTTTTMFPVGSVTKQFTCSAALLMEQDGKLSMRDPVAKYAPNATAANRITLLDLGQHVSGYRDYYPLDFVDREMQVAVPADTIIARYATRPLDFEPGTRWSYSNTNFTILGKAVEVASGKSLAAVMQERIFKPVGMTRTAFDPPASDTGMASGYTSYALAAPSPARPEASGWTGAAGAIFSTPTDLLKWDLALIDGKVLSPASYATLTTPRTLADGRSTGYGCGMMVRLTGDAIVLQHGGVVAGSVAQNIILPGTRSAIAILSNADFAATGEIINAAMQRLTPRVDVPKVAGLPALDAAKAFLSSVERGTVDRATLGDDFNALLTPEHLAADRKSLAANGPITDVRIVAVRERGGMEVAQVQFMVGKTPASSAMYRTPDGKIQQFLINRR